MQNKQTKIFCIGLSKTGTSSLAAALNILGYRTKDNIGVGTYISEDLDSSVDLTIIDKNDAFTDTPIPSFYQDLDIRYPNSKFILTVRELNGWLNSCRKQFNRQAVETRSDVVNQLFRDIYDTPFFEEEKFTRGYQRFVERVLDYFRNRPDDLLVMDITAGEDWEKLCPFLSKDIPDQPFPMTNVTKIQWINIDDLAAIAREAGQELLKNQKKVTAAHFTGNHGLLASGLKLIRRDKDNILEKAIKKSSDSLVTGLQKLTPDIPFLSSLDTDIPYSVRKSWNHLWLIDPLNGKDQYINGNDDFCLSFSLVQDGEPIMGVIYNPKTGIVHYAKRGKGAYLKVEKSDPVKLEKPSKGDECPNGIIFGQQQLNIDAAERYLKKTYPEVRLITQTIPVSKTLAFDLIFSGNVDILFMAEPTWEWETGAAQIILKETGKNLYDFATREENRYNKPDLKNNSLIVR